MQLYQRSALGLVLASAFTVGCGGSQSAPVAPAPSSSAVVAPPPSAAAPAPTDSATVTPPPAASDSAAAAPPPPPGPGHEGMHHGMEGMLVASLADVELRPDQKPVVDGIVHDLEQLGSGTKDAQHALASDVADGVAAGKIDKTKTDADVKKVTEAATTSVASMQDAVNRLHKTLDPAQRKKLVESMRAKGEEFHEHEEHEHMGHEHGEGHEGHEGEGHEHGPDGEGGPGEKLADDLGLSPDQKEKLHAKMKEEMKADHAQMKTRMEGMKAHMKAIGDAFETETFDAKHAGVGEHGPDMAREMATGRVRMAEAVLAILTPDQRAKFADHIRSHADEEH